MFPLPKTLFGNSKAEHYLVDTLNELQSPKVTGRCMAMISGSRGWCARIRKPWDMLVMSSKDFAHVVRLHKTDTGRTFTELNRELDEELAAWTPVLTDEGYIKKTLEVRALKLAMNIASACQKQLARDIELRRGF